MRAAALAALHALILAVGSADAMAFFVPGIVTSLGRSLAEAGGGGACTRFTLVSPGAQLKCHAQITAESPAGDWRVP